jgi:hypothetical protein
MTWKVESLNSVRGKIDEAVMKLMLCLLAVMDMEKGEDRLMNFKREANNKNEISDEDF